MAGGETSNFRDMVFSESPFDRLEIISSFGMSNNEANVSACHSKQCATVSWKSRVTSNHSCSESIGH